MSGYKKGSRMSDHKKELTCKYTGEKIAGDFIHLDAAEWAANVECPICGTEAGEECWDEKGGAITPWVHAARAEKEEAK